MSVDPDAVKEQLRDGGEEYHYRDANCDIDGNKSGESSLHIGHFVVKKDARGQKIATTVLNALFDVMREEGLTSLTIKMGATECDTIEDLEERKQDAAADGETYEDPTYEFLEGFGFRQLDYENDWQWGLCVTGIKLV